MDMTVEPDRAGVAIPSREGVLGKWKMLQKTTEAIIEDGFS
jgi:hypothetical protein